MSQQEDARDILTALRGNDSAETPLPHPGDPPDVSKMNEQAAAAAMAPYLKKCEAYVSYLNSKPAGALTEAEQKILWKVAMAKLRGE